MNEYALDELRPGEAGHIVSLDRNHPLRRRLLELGFVRGAKVVVVRRAPLGDPIELRVGSTDLALRRADLHGIRVRQ
ncbi:FeoA family protein [Deinococcus radiodurans]|jgi:Fe2+ transport system protein A|uniref:Ferrous iron transport protein A n=1 Tax=Deinococcus radiodurans (strain ATCC 13939 / DSM 20539 / JCM 16871 / CCUG 27074 / LMG 4051 / NBRC 15346 / NCIMB 9279 / VKM B-1422 / R1) TaxID=243230 RepID=Q9RV10_DEIRA|nr:ferrous iron transport protein A [Deinococcus radiodurans]AAF10791.1 ferrous iron transport protein A [Deinococcus radiodurans R1 = ATCC 13939 = DSM 20539]ANC71614.1 iron transporter [Deinococcus radiodurans R1 = ATCC 13939 = DSM 20539]QEM70695.1 iron transporter [Deinococcus radiodurans]QIP29290.1 ferrous iron transport protein A [Deinococcus radiodurans]QIP32018.1 ferrous iron transport protein A [Deinococcus radiodurans]